MAIERPGRPEDLPAAELLWARWALLAALETTAAEDSARRDSGHWLDEDGLRYDDCGCTWWTFAPFGPGRYVLYGEDESSGVKWHEPAVDMLAGGPDWLPYETLHELRESWQLGCVYWYEDGAWARAPYPDTLADDGLDCGMSELADRDRMLSLLADFEHLRSREGAAVLLDGAERHALARGEVETALAPAYAPEDAAAIVRALERSGLLAVRAPAV
ncbi:hypothetical protein ACIQUQ_20430 [Streptomyces sp. NPDC101118]|uniref:hypothetical protein n=1 Tax=Streptomyces sp. NPDC101118 TaxID=3366109 RepID=UPI0037F60A89